MQHEQECCARALQADEQHQQAAAARANAIADEATARCRQAKETCRRTALAKKKHNEDTLTAEERQRVAIAAATQEASEFAGRMASLQADITELLRVAVLAVEADD